MEGLEIKVDEYLSPVIETVTTQDINLEELVVACFHCDPASAKMLIS